MPDTLTHLTITTGDIACTARADVDDAVIALLTPLVATEGGAIPGPTGWYCDLWWPLAGSGARIPGAAVYQIAPGRADTPAGKAPYVMAAACWREEASAAACQQAQHLAAMMPSVRTPAMALPVPWLAVTVLPMAMTLSAGDLAALGDLERCLFWAIAEAQP